jgi:hypothetical protein
MKRILSFLILASIKGLVRIFYFSDFSWTPSRSEIDFDRARVMVFLNHTSLYEPVFLSELPFGFLWKIASRINLPIADMTLKRPIVGMFFRMMLPKVYAITRKSDSSWQGYLGSIERDDLVIIAAEGRMKRPNGLDKHGKKMTVRGGVADIIERIPEGTILLCHSGGLHHIQKPGQLLPKIFQAIRMHVTELEVSAYRAQFSSNPRERKIQMAQDLQERLDQGIPVL